MAGAGSFSCAVTAAPLPGVVCAATSLASLGSGAFGCSACGDGLLDSDGSLPSSFNSLATSFVFPVGCDQNPKTMMAIVLLLWTEYSTWLIGGKIEELEVGLH